MASEKASSLKSGTWVVIGIITLAVVLLVVSRLYRIPAQDGTHELLQQEGMTAARQGIALSQEGKKLLPVEEQREMEQIYAEALGLLRPEERQRFLALAQKGTAARDQEIAESAALIQKALRALPQERSERLWGLIEKAVQLAQQKAKAPRQ